MDKRQGIQPERKSQVFKDTSASLFTGDVRVYMYIHVYMHYMYTRALIFLCESSAMFKSLMVSKYEEMFSCTYQRTIN